MARSVNASPYFNKKLIVPSLVESRANDDVDGRVEPKAKSALRNSHIDYDIKLPSFSSSAALDQFSSDDDHEEGVEDDSGSTTPSRAVEFTSPRTVQGGLAGDSNVLGSELGSAFTDHLGDDDDIEASKSPSRLRKSTLLASLVRANLNSESDAPGARQRQILSRTKPSEEAEPITSPLITFATDKEPAVKAKVEDVLRALEAEPQAAVAELLEGVLRMSGVRATIAAGDVKCDDPMSVLEAFLANQSIIQNAPVGNVLKNKHVMARFGGLFRGIGASGLGIDAVCSVVSDLLVPWLMAMSSVSLRSLRMTATVAGLSILVGGSECARSLQRAAESTKRVNRTNVKAVSDKLAACERCLQAVFEAVFVQRYRDVSDDVRAFALQSLVACMQNYPTVYVDNAYLRYLGWSLTDPSGHVRSEALAALNRLYTATETSLVASFTERFQDRLLQVVQRDRANRGKALGVLDIAFAKGLITLDATNVVKILLPVLSTTDEWQKIGNVLKAVPLAQVLQSALDVDDWSSWLPTLEALSGAVDLTDDLAKTPFAVFWVADREEDILAYCSHGQLAEFAVIHLAHQVSDMSNVSDDLVKSLFERAASMSAEACRLLLPKLSDSLAHDLMALLSRRPQDHRVGILALSNVVAPPAANTKTGRKKVTSIEDLQIEYKRLLWAAKNNELVWSELKALHDSLVAILTTSSKGNEEVALALGMWADLLLLSHRRKSLGSEGEGLEFEEKFLDHVVKRVHSNSDGERALAICIGKLLLASLLLPQTAVRDLCAIEGDFAEYPALLDMALERFFSEPSVALASKLSFARGVLLVRADLAKSFLGAIRTALSMQEDPEAVRHFVLAVAEHASGELWSSINASFLLRADRTLRAEASAIRAVHSKRPAPRRKTSPHSANDQPVTVPESDLRSMMTLE